ncbi:MAG: hypothetical protein JWN79_911 [Gemmatimonadetes bacterium]|nr:hypothetical protein [Gemmatimonadota bacterium]
MVEWPSSARRPLRGLTFCQRERLIEVPVSRPDPMMPLLRASLSLVVLLAGCAATTTPNGAPAAAPLRTRGAAPIVVVSPAEPREQTADQQVQHVLDRLAFGPRPGDVARVRALGVDQWIALQLAPDRIDDAAAERALSSYETLRLPTAEVMRMYADGQLALRRLQRAGATPGDSASGKDQRAELLRDNPAVREQLRRTQRVLADVQSARLARAVVSDRQLQEVMTDFWENHFTVYAGKGITRLLVPAYDRDVIRPLALGRFRDLLGAVAKSPAMLFFLDQWQSAADSTHPTLAGAPRLRAGVAARRPRGLNENYARELMELHTRGVDAGYSQGDVIEVARALTGWTMVSRTNPQFVFRPQIHDAGAKTVLGHRLPAGRGIEDGEEVLDILARDPHTARFVAHKLAVRFVSDAPPESLVSRATATYLRTDGDLREVVRTIVTSPEFFSRAAYRSKVKSPFELVASALRAVGADADSTPRSAQAVGLLGQPIFGHQAPNGWPETGDAWMNAGAILNRINFGLALAGGRLPGATLSHWPQAAALQGATREAQVDAVIGAFLGGHASPDTRDILLKGENPLAARLAGADSGRMEASDAAMQMDRDVMMDGAPARKNGQPRPGAARRPGLGQPVQLTGLAQVVGLAIGAPEFQRR